MTWILWAKNALYDIEMLYNGRDDVINFFDDYSTIASETRYKAIKGERIKILTVKQMYQILPVTLAQAIASNISEISLNEICQIIYSLYLYLC